MKQRVLLVALAAAVASLWAGPLHDAAKAGDLKKVDQLLAEGADINKLDRRRGGLTALHHASLWGRLEVVERLIKAGADPNTQASFWGGENERSFLPFHAASMGAHKNIVDYFVREHKINPRATFLMPDPMEHHGGRGARSKPKTYEMNAVHLAMFFFFIAEHSMEDYKPLLDAGRLVDFVRHMEEKGVRLSNDMPIEQQKGVPMTMPLLAARIGATALLKHLVEERQMPMNSTNKEVPRIMYAAVQSGEVDTVRYLVSKGESLGFVYDAKPMQISLIQEAAYLRDKAKALRMVAYLLSAAAFETGQLEKAWRTLKGKGNEKALSLVEMQLKKQGWQPPPK